MFGNRMKGKITKNILINIMLFIQNKLSSAIQRLKRIINILEYFFSFRFGSLFNFGNYNGFLSLEFLI